MVKVKFFFLKLNSRLSYKCKMNVSKIILSKLLINERTRKRFQLVQKGVRKTYIHEPSGIMKWIFRSVEQKSVASPNGCNAHFHALGSFALLLICYNLVLYYSADNEKRWLNGLPWTRKSIFFVCFKDFHNFTWELYGLGAPINTIYVC